MKKRIVIITGVFLPEPIVSAGLMADIAEKLAEKYDVVVLRPHPTRPMGFKVPQFGFCDKPYKVIELDSFTCPKSSIIGRFRESYSYGQACKKYIESHKDEIHFIYNSPWHIFGRDIVMKTCLKYGIAYATPVQDIYPESLLSKLPQNTIIQGIAKAFLFPYDKRLLQNASLIHTISNSMRDYLSKTRFVDKSKFVVVRNWQNEKDFTDYRNNRKDVAGESPFTFMYMGNIGPVAGVDLLLEAFQKANLKDARLVIAGSGSVKNALMEKAKVMRDCNILFWEVPFGQVPATQDKADVMCLPIKKGFASSSIPSKLPAYMFSAKAIICCADLDSDTSRCVADAACGWAIEPENADMLACTMRTAYETGNAKLHEMGIKGFEYGINNFSRSMNLQRLYNACIKVIENS